MSSSNQKIHREISVKDFLEKSVSAISLETVLGENFLAERKITSARIQKLGLALAGFSHYIHEGRLQIVGQSEISYLEQLSSQEKIEAVGNLDLEKICCILLTKNLNLPSEFLEIAKQKKLPILRTPEVSSTAIGTVSGLLQKILAPQTTLHAVLLGMYGLGVLLLGESGIGKSECALDLITRGHQLISDDTVIIKKIGENLEGSAPDLIFEHLEIRGLGIINIRDLFGVSSVGKQIKIDLCIQIKKWNDIDDIERLGLKTDQEKIFGIQIPKFILPVSSGRNISTLVETAVRVHLLRLNGYDAAQKLIKKHTEILAATGD